MTRVVMPIAERDFDPTEVAVVWRALRDRNIEVRFATATGQEAVPDQMMLTGEGLDLWGLIPGLKRLRVLGLLMRADRHARDAYRRMWGDPWFQSPRSYASLKVQDFDGMVLCGGHRARGMAEFLEKSVLQKFVGAYFTSGKPVGAIGQGVLLAARSCSPITGRSSLHGRRTTALTWSLEQRAVNLSRFFGRFWDTNYFRVYPETESMPPGALSIESQVKAALEHQAHFIKPSASLLSLLLKRSGMFRDKPTSSRAAHVVVDDSYVSARWQGDAHTFAREFVDIVSEHHESGRVAPKIRDFADDDEHKNERSRAWT